MLKLKLYRDVFHFAVPHYFTVTLCTRKLMIIRYLLHWCTIQECHNSSRLMRYFPALIFGASRLVGVFSPCMCITDVGIWERERSQVHRQMALLLDSAQLKWTGYIQFCQVRRHVFAVGFYSRTWVFQYCGLKYFFKIEKRLLICRSCVEINVTI